MNNYRKHPIIVQTDPVHNCTVVIPATSGEMGGGVLREVPLTQPEARWPAAIE